jgi:MFS family permease
MQTQHRKPPPFENTPLLGADHGYDNTTSYGHRDVESRSSGHRDRSHRDIAPPAAKPPIIDHSDYACLVKIPRAWLSTISVLSALHNCLWAGSVLIFSLYAPLFNQKLGYRQMQINAVSTASELGMYLPVPVFGFICDQYGPAKLSLMSTSFFGPGYALAAAAYANNWDYKIMVVAFGLIGMGSSAMYFSGITACAKAIQGRRGLALAMPIACFGLSSLWEAQLVTYLFTGPDSILQVEKVFAFFSIAMPLVGMLGFLGLSPLDINREDSVSTESEDLDDKGFFNSETMAFLKDRTMWAFATGVFLVTGPGEAFINNVFFLLFSAPAFCANTTVDGQPNPDPRPRGQHRNANLLPLPHQHCIATCRRRCQ